MTFATHLDCVRAGQSWSLRTGFCEIPFADLVAPFVRSIVTRGVTSGGFGRLTAGGVHTLELSLARSCVRICGKVLWREFDLYRSKYRSPIADMVARAASVRRTKLYDAFVRHHLATEFEEIFQKYSLLRPMLNVHIAQTTQCLQTFFLRLVADSNELTSRWSIGRGESIAECRFGMSDPHSYGETVIRVQFEHSGVFYYKPRGGWGDALWDQLAEALNRWGFHPVLRTAESVLGVDHVWQRNVNAVPCRTLDEVSLYYQRAGAFLCLAHLVEATDLHFENLVADGQCPVFIDLETLLVPRRTLGSPALSQALSTLAWDMDESVLRTNILPEWQFRYDGIALDLSALGGLPAPGARPRVLRLLNVDTDDMSNAVEMATWRPGKHAVRLEDEPVRPWLYVEPLCEGFRRAWSLVCANKHEVASLVRRAVLVDGNTRFVFRPTLAYEQTLSMLRHPDALSCKKKHDQILDELALPFADRERIDPVWSLLEAERRSLERGDVPLFRVRHRDGAVAIDDDWVLGIVESNVLSRFEGRIRRMELEGCEAQERLIHTAMDLYRMPFQSNERPLAESRISDGPSGALDDRAARQAALSIGDELLRNVVRSPDGSVSWISFDHDHTSGLYKIQHGTDDLYGGVAGVGVFFAALYAETGSPEYYGAACAILRQTEKSLAELNQLTCERLLEVPQGAAGVGGALYGAALMRSRLGAVTSVPSMEILTRLCDLAPRMRRCDVVLGLAGLVLGGLAWCNVSEAVTATDLMPFVSQLLKLQHKEGFWRGAFPSEGALPWTGFSHGASGVGFAMARYSRAAKCEAAATSSYLACHFEDRLYAPAHANWMDLREVREWDDELFGNDILFGARSWCHGAPGICLARNEIDRLLGGQRSEKVALAVEELGRMISNDLDNLCCGAVGQLETLHQIGQSELVRRHLFSMVDAAGKEGAYALLGRRYRGVVPPSLYQGVSGVGYQLLRLASRISHPSVLLWEVLGGGEGEACSSS